MVPEPFTFVVYVLAIPLSYLALWIADAVRPIDVSLRRRLLVVVLSAVVTTPVLFLSIFLYPLILLIDWVLIRWIYVDTWGGAIIRVLLWYLLAAIFGVLIGIFSVALFLVF